jgi:hypothetical protein
MCPDDAIMAINQVWARVSYSPPWCDMYAIQCIGLIFQDRDVLIFSISKQVWARVVELAFGKNNYDGKYHNFRHFQL